MRWATFVSNGGAEIQLMEPAADSPLGRRLAKHGEHVHHICFTTDDPDETARGSPRRGSPRAARSRATRRCRGSAGPGCCPTAPTARSSRSRGRTARWTASGSRPRRPTPRRSRRRKGRPWQSTRSWSSAAARWATASPRWSRASGLEVTIVDVDDGALERARTRIDRSLERFVKSERLSHEDADAARARISTSTDLDAAAEAADHVIETVIEDLDVKRDVLETARRAPAATTSSSPRTPRSSRSRRSPRPPRAPTA